MQFDKILEELNKASLFELYRLSQAIWTQLDDPERNQQIRHQLRVGQNVSYFDMQENRLIDAIILGVKRTRVLVKNKHNDEQWNIYFYQLNLDATNVDIKPRQETGIDRNSLKVDDYVSFIDNTGQEVFGQVFKLNPKTAGVLVGNSRWRVNYRSLNPVLDGQMGEQLILDCDVINLKKSVEPTATALCTES